ncbi:MAG: DUF460 domain-containing protein [Candidatus Altiarchaeota archaeon]|nr:DUF460 domain-containing protein [Candidatus Altiarchaeota archaeon]
MHLIVGVDPGTTTGIAAITLDGKVLDVHSSRDTGVDQAVKYITKLGRPSIIASDVTPTPDFVLKIAASLGCAVFTLYEPLSVAEKNMITAGYPTEDLHTRDALAAALNAYNKYKNKLQKITALGYGDEVKHKVLQGNALERAITEITAEKTIATKNPTPQKTPRIIPSIQSLEKQNILLKEQNKLLEFEIAKLRKKIEQEKKPANKPEENTRTRQQEQIIDSLNYRIKLLENRLKEADQTRHLWKEQAKEKIKPVGLYPEIYSGLTIARSRLNSTDAEKMSKAILVFTNDQKNRELLSRWNIPSTDEKHVQQRVGLHYLAAEELSKLLKTRATSLAAIINEYRAIRGAKG